MINFLLGEIGTFNNLVTALGAVSTVVDPNAEQAPTLTSLTPDRAGPHPNPSEERVHARQCRRRRWSCVPRGAYPIRHSQSPPPGTLGRPASRHHRPPRTTA